MAMLTSSPGSSDAGTAAIAASFSIGLGAAAGEGAEDDALTGAGLPIRRKSARPYQQFNLPPGLLTATTVGSFLDLPGQFAPPVGWLWDVVSLSVYGFTAGSVAVSKNAPMVAPGGAQVAIEQVANFAAAGVLAFPRKGLPLLDSSERLVFTVTGAITGYVQVSGFVVAVPAERIGEYLA